MITPEDGCVGCDEVEGARPFRTYAHTNGGCV